MWLGIIFTEKYLDFHRWESIREFIAGLGNLDYRHIRLRMCILFAKNGINSSNRTIKYMSLRHYISNLKNICTSHNIYFERELKDTSIATISFKIFQSFSQDICT